MNFNFSSMSIDNKARVVLILVFLISMGSFFYNEICERFFVVLRDSDISKINSDCFLAVIPICAVALFILFIAKKELLKDFKVYLLLALFLAVSFFYFKSTFLLSNAYLDKSEPVVHDLKVTDKFQSGNKVISCFIKVPSWLDGEADFLIKVPYEIYSAMNVGNRVEILTKKGKFGFEWIKELKKINP